MVDMCRTRGFRTKRGGNRQKLTKPPWIWGMIWHPCAHCDITPCLLWVLIFWSWWHGVPMVDMCRTRGFRTKRGGNRQKLTKPPWIWGMIWHPCEHCDMTPWLLMGFDFLELVAWCPHGGHVSKEGFSDEKRGKSPKTHQTTMDWGKIWYPCGTKGYVIYTTLV